MNTMIITRGIPASGKSTYARSWVAEDPENRIEVNRDNIRAMMGFPARGTPEQENSVTAIHRSMIAESIKHHRDIIVSDTNMKSRGIRDIAAPAVAVGYSIVIKDFTIDFDTAVQRDRNREDSVGEEVIRNFYHRSKGWQSADDIIARIHSGSPVMPPYRNDPAHTPAILVDVDGTIAHNDGVRDYHDYTESVMRDTPDMSVIKAVQIAHASGIRIIIMSGRKDSCREHTIQWMRDHGVPFDDIFMRKSDDNRADWIVKDELVREHIQDNYYVMWCYDDRNQVVNHHRKMGYQVFQVAPGDF